VISDATGLLDEAYLRLHKTGPEFEGWLSNHAPMAAEAMARHGHAEEVGEWLDGYVGRLEEFPRGAGPIGADWRDALGDPRRIADWTVFYQHEVAEQPWRDVVVTWWPRLLPGLAASATHGIIRTGHAVRALLADGEDQAHVTELAHALAYWAARWQPVPGTQTRPAADGTSPCPAPAAALGAVPRLTDQSGGYRARLPRLAQLAGWSAALAAPLNQGTPEQARAWLSGLADAAVIRYLDQGHGNPVMLVHSATAPTAVLRTLPVLPEDLWAPSAIAAFDAAAAITAIYAPAEPAPPRAVPPRAIPGGPAGPEATAEIFDRAVEHGDEHVIKFADTAIEVYGRTGDPAALDAASCAVESVPRPE